MLQVCADDGVALVAERMLDRIQVVTTTHTNAALCVTIDALTDETRHVFGVWPCHEALPAMEVAYMDLAMIPVERDAGRLNAHRATWSSAPEVER